jgi:hypothetical protein
MSQGAENDLFNIRYYQESFSVLGIVGGTGPDNDPIVDLNLNTLLVDNKAIFARDTADTVTLDLSNHIGAFGPLEHADVTITDAGFMSSADKIKLDGIQNKAQNNILALDDELSLISRKDSILHQHPQVTTTVDGFMSAADKTKLNGIETGAQVNNINTSQASILKGGGLADTLHIHDHDSGTETFTQAVHALLDHTGVTGVPGFPGFTTAESYFISSDVSGTFAVQIFSHAYSFAPELVQAGWRKFKIDDWDYDESWKIDNIAISGNSGVVTFSRAGTGPGGYSSTIGLWQGAFG